MILVVVVVMYFCLGTVVLDYLLKTRFLRPLTWKEMLRIILTWPTWL